MPAVTLVIPLYNGAPFIAETLDSVLAQSTRPAEVIVVDDGSSDGGPEVVRNHPVGARLIEQSHLGVAVARNHGLLETRTRWVTFLDQDDLWHPSRLERMLAWTAGHPEDRLVMTREIAFSAVEEVSELGHQDPLVGEWASLRVSARDAYGQLCSHADVTGSPEVERFDQSSMLRGPVSVTTSFMAEADLLRLAGGFAPHALAMDDYWLLVVAAKICPVTRVDQPTVFYRVHTRATSRTTRLALPFLSSAVALRLGGGLVDPALAEVEAGPLHEHLLEEILRSPEYGDRRVRRAVRHLAGLLWPDARRATQLKALVRLRLPWAVGLRRRVS